MPHLVKSRPVVMHDVESIRTNVISELSCRKINCLKGFFVSLSNSGDILEFNCPTDNNLLTFLAIFSSLL